MSAASKETGESQIREGFLVADKYRLVSAIGEGAMGAVWSAEHTSLGHRVAIKFLHGSVANAAEPRARFEREARLAAKLGEASRHVTRVMDHGVLADGTPFLVMEYLQGEGLEVRLKRERRLPIALVAKITGQLARALHVAHGAGVIHRDLKPANVFLCESQDDGGLLVKLLDFGVAKATLDHDENQATRQGALIGTPNYMSPEQITGDPLDARSDLWALAAIVYRMCVGRAPFGSGSLNELAMRILSTEPPTPTGLAPDLPHEFDLWVQKGLAKKPQQRFQSARELADSLAMVAGVSATGNTGTFSSAAAERLALQIGDSVAGLQHTLGDSSTQLSARRPRRRGTTWAVLAAFVVVAASGIGLYATRMHAKATTAAPEPPAPQVTSTNEAPPTQSAAPQAASAEPMPPPESAPKTPETAEAPSASAPAPKATAPKPKTFVAAPPKTAAPKPDPTVAAPPPPPPPPTPTETPVNLWKKKDEM